MREALMRSAEAWLHDLGIPKLQLMVRRSNDGAAAFYGRLGYSLDEVDVYARWLGHPPD
jgi:ribosomal protein S18 acetylase RimI-like enzyme